MITVVSPKVVNVTRFVRGMDEMLRRAIGEGIEIETPFGTKPLIYADYVASGRALVQVEDFVRDEVLPRLAARLGGSRPLLLALIVVLVIVKPF